ncbi:uncharacterized protein LOC120281140 [Dioscorea cayenensis subsp. rotundata]|uniref:Uncharacterized protein LOC120281140 n=1 Tax=Dioscorea cayennensis subsp. rotundata TaxID=55577 RepID=A0AB40CV40_DIOCR|nr:uncharacterized protein LOC120281140 [Dioscorea cayenensis subsp. rotundata]
MVYTTNNMYYRNWYNNYDNKYGTNYNRCSAKNFFLTYPQCSLSKEEALSQLLAIPLPSNKKFIRVARELHEDGQPHLHTARSFSDVKAYVEKERDYTDWGEFQIDGRSSRGGSLNLSEVYTEALNASSADESLQIIQEKDPKSFYLQYHNLKANAELIFTCPVSVFKSKWDLSSFTVDNVIS